MKELFIVAALVALPGSMAIAADSHADHGKHVAQATATQTADGEVRKIDKSAKKITIKHGDIKSLGMPPMTMVFQAKDPALLDKVKVGDKIKFAAEQTGGALIVTGIDVVN